MILNKKVPTHTHIPYRTKYDNVCHIFKFLAFDNYECLYEMQFSFLKYFLLMFLKIICYLQKMYEFAMTVNFLCRILL